MTVKGASQFFTFLSLLLWTEGFTTGRTRCFQNRLIQSPFSRHLESKPSDKCRNVELGMSLVDATIRVNDIVYSKKVVIFGVSDDAHTLRIKYLFDEGHVQYTTVYLDLLDDGPEMMEGIKHMTGRTQVPCIYIDGKFVGGHDHIFAMNLDGHLGKLFEEIGAIPYDRMRELKQIWKQPPISNLSGTRGQDATLT